MAEYPAGIATAVEFDPFAGPEIARLVPTTEPQAEIWMACRLGGADASRAYNESVSLRLHGTLDKNALEQAVQALIRRHESLRSAFSADGQQMCVFRQRPIDVSFADVTRCPAAEKEAAIQTYIRQDAQFVFDLIEGPLLNVGLIKLADDEHHLTITAHHIVCDGWSMGIMLQDLSKLYSAITQTIFPDLPPVALFSRYADEQFAFTGSDDYQQIEQFWLAQFRNDVPVLNLPTDTPRPALRTFASHRLDYTLEPELVAALKRMGAKAGCSFVTTLLAAFEVYVHQLTGQDALVIGLPAAGQSATGNNRLVGHCVNLLPLRSFPTGDQSFVDFLKQRKGQLFDAYEHQRLTFGSLLRKLNMARNASRVPLVPVVFNIDMGLADGVNFYGLDYELVNNPRAYENFELFLNATGTEKALVLEWSYNRQLFRAATIDRMMTGFRRVLTDIVADPTLKINAIGGTDRAGAPALADAYDRLNDTDRPYPTDKTLTQLIGAQAQTTPGNIAVRFGNDSLTYRDLETKANQFAHYLLANGVKPDDRIGLAIDRSADLLVALLGIMKGGATYIPLDPAYPQERLDFMLQDSGATLLITSAHSADVFRGSTTRICLEAVLSELAAYPATEPNRAAGSSGLAYVLYTSGSTGKPKGVQITHRNLVNFLLSMQHTPGITAADRLLAITTISFDIAGLELFLPLISGATVVLADARTAKEGKALLQLLDSEKITIMQATPSTWRMMLDAGWSEKRPLKALCGGEALPQDVAVELVAKCDSLWNMYGPTETTIWSAVKQIRAEDAVITVGKPIANTRFYVLDDRQLPVAVDTVGELFIAGDGVARGYLNRPDLTAERFISDPFGSRSGETRSGETRSGETRSGETRSGETRSGETRSGETRSGETRSGQTMYRTGDLGKLLPSGEIQCLGRADQQVKLRGYRIEPGEIETVLMAFADVKQAVVVIREKRPGDGRLVACIVPASPLTADEFNQRIPGWRSGLKAVLPAHMLPAEFDHLSAIPLTPNGKIDRNALSQLNSTSVPAVTPPQTGYMGPRTDVEKLVADIWLRYLGIDRVSIYDNFFELGGHSLIAVQVMDRLEKETGKRLPLATLFEHSTVEQLALMLEMDGKSITWDSLVPIKPQGSKTPLYIVHGAGLNVLLFNALAKNMDAEQPVYGLQAKGLNGIDEPLDSIEAIAEHYVASIMAKNPDGPYALAGYSFGGIIAFEMTRQFQALGKTVTMLAMFDTYAYQSDHHDPWFSRMAYRTKSFVKKLLYTFVLLKDDPKRTIEYKTEQLSRKLTETYWKLRHGKDQKQEAFFGYSYKLDLMNELASQNYRLAPYPVTIELFRAKKLTFYMDDFEFLGWKPFALNGVNIHEIPGEHNYIFAPPNDQEFARILQQTLDACINVSAPALQPHE